MATSFIRSILSPDELYAVVHLRMALSSCYIFDTLGIGFRIDPLVHRQLSEMNQIQKIWLLYVLPDHMQEWLRVTFSDCFSTVVN